MKYQLLAITFALLGLASAAPGRQEVTKYVTTTVTQTEQKIFEKPGSTSVTVFTQLSTVIASFPTTVWQTSTSTVYLTSTTTSFVTLGVTNYIPQVSTYVYPSVSTVYYEIPGKESQKTVTSTKQERVQIIKNVPHTLHHTIVRAQYMTTTETKTETATTTFRLVSYATTALTETKTETITTYLCKWGAVTGVAA